MPTEIFPITLPRGLSATRGTVMPLRVRHQSGPGIHVCRVESQAMAEFHLTVKPMAGETAAAVARRLAAFVNEHNATVVRCFAFGSVAVARTVLGTLRQGLDDPALPVMWVEGSAGDGNPLAGIQVHAVAGAEVGLLNGEGGVQARVWNDGAARHCVLGGLMPPSRTGSRAEQAHATFELMHAGLAQAGLTMKDVARTWFYLDDILAWYGDFNRVRSDFFARMELSAGSFPASTGVSGRNPAEAALGLTAWAVRSLDPASPAFVMVPSPQQCPAPAYGSAFSRAVEIRSPGFRQLIVSGTASIEPGGRTAHVGDVRAQIGLSMQVVMAILESRQMGLADVSRATAYFRSAADAPLLADWLACQKAASMPVVNTRCDICRDDLLFEIELDAIKAGSFAGGS